MNQQDYPTQYSDSGAHFSAQIADPSSFSITQTVGDEEDQNGFSVDSMLFRQQFNGASSYANYADTSPTDMTQGWTFAQEAYISIPQQPTTQQNYPPLLSQLSTSKSLGSDEGDETSEPTSPPDEVSERRREVSSSSIQLHRVSKSPCSLLIALCRSSSRYKTSQTSTSIYVRCPQD